MCPLLYSPSTGQAVPCEGEFCPLHANGLLSSCPSMSDAAYNSTRLWTVVALCLLRLAMTRHHLQAYLQLAERWVEQMKREAGRITALEIQRRVGTSGAESNSGSWGKKQIQAPCCGNSPESAAGRSPASSEACEPAPFSWP